MPDRPTAEPNPDGGTADFVNATRRELRRERRRRLAAFVLAGALLLAAFGAAFGPPDDWDGAGRVGFIAMCALGGGVGGLRMSGLASKDN